MSKSKIIVLVFAVVFITQPLLALAGIPDATQCEASLAYSGPGTPSLLVVPDGSGNPFTEAHDEEGNVVDATITLIIRDGAGVPIYNYPAEDCWLESVDGGIARCIGGATADFNSDLDGMTQWINPVMAGGNSQAGVRVVINGNGLLEVLGLYINSPDMDGNGVVNLVDVAHFAGCYFGPYCFAADMNGDGVVNLPDLSIFAGHIGAICP
jgi:hypothetical protein